MSAAAFMTALAVSTAVIGLLMLVGAWLMPRARHWPLYWGAGLIAGVSTAVFAVILSALGVSIPQIQIASLPLHDTLTPVNWPALIGMDAPQSPASVGAPILSSALLYIYVAGVVFSLLRLGIGRYRAAMIARGSTKTELADGTCIGLTPAPVACFTLTPFGRPHKSQIIVSEQFRKSLTDSELQQVIQHEKGHIVRRDDEFGILLRVIAALSWFNPISHIMFHRWTMSAELQCDQIVTQGHAHPMRRAYANTLLKALHMPAGRVQQYPAASLSTHRLRNEKMRINHIMQGSTPIFKHIGHKLLLLTAAIGLSASGAVFMSAPSSAETPPQIQAPEAKPALRETVQPETPKTENVQAETPLQADIHLVAETHPQDNQFNLQGTLSSPYGKAESPFKKGTFRNHFGVDFKAPTGTPIYAPAAGIITAATASFNGNANYGNVVVLQTSDGVQTMMAHLDSYAVTEGQAVIKGQKIAEIGSTGKSTGPHVHIETRKNGRRVDPMSVWQFVK